MANPLLSIVMPALNEENNIKLAIDSTLDAFTELKINGEIIIINDGSSDRTPAIVKESMLKESRIRLLTHDLPKGIGASFWDGVDVANGDIVCMLPGDNENEPKEILRYLKLLDDVDMVIPFVYNKKVRSMFRNVMSKFFVFLINSTFGLSFKYTTGTTLYRKSILKELKNRDFGFFFQTDILVRLAKRGYLFCEVPYSLKKRIGGKSKAVSFKSLMQIIRGYVKLVKDICIIKSEGRGSNLRKDSVSYKRYEKNAANQL